MAAIIDVSGDRRLQLGNEEFVRSFNFGARWQKINIGFHFGVNAIQGFNARICIGVCDGPYGVNAPFSPGVVFSCPGLFTSGGATWAATTNGFSNGGGTRQPITKTGSTTVGGSSVGVGTTIMPSAPLLSAKTLGMWMIQLERSLTNWNSITYKSSWTAAAQIGQVIEPFTFYKNLENDLGTSFYGMPNMDGGSTHAYAGFLDHCCITWDKSCPTLEFSKIGVVRLA